MIVELYRKRGNSLATIQNIRPYHTTIGLYGGFLATKFIMAQPRVIAQKGL
jgi:hypothetical protein